jgi:hypothetical protein
MRGSGRADRAALALLGIALGLNACGGSATQAARQRAANAEPTPSPVVAQLEPTAPAVAGCPAGRTVSNAAGLSLALASATPGAVILLAAGSYQGHFVASVSGTEAAPITLCGTHDSAIDGGAVKSGYALHLNAVSWWRLIGFSVQGGQKGVVADQSNHLLISGLTVHGIGDEAIHLRKFSSDNIVEGVTIRDTGLLRAKFGEGIYIGSAQSNWCQYTSCGPDTSDRNIIRNNDISQTTAENIDIKEGTTGGTVSGNHLSGVGMDSTAAHAWLNAKGNQWTIVGNVGERSIKDGFQVHEVARGWGQQNILRANQAAVDGPGFGFYVQSVSLGTVLGCDNVVSGAASGFSNTKCTN